MNKPNMSRYQFWNKQTLGLVLGVALIVFLLNFFKGWSIRFQPPFVFEYNFLSPMSQEERDRQDRELMKAVILDEMVKEAVKGECPNGEKGKDTTKQTNTLLRTSGEVREPIKMAYNPPREIAQYIDKWANHWGADPDTLSCVLFHESTYRTDVTGDNGKAYGIAQFHLPTFQWFRAKMGLNGSDMRGGAESSIQVMAWAFAHGYGNHWTPYKLGKCQ